MKKIACVILPTYNEAENIPVIIPWLFRQDSKILSHELHVLVVDDNSPDGTQHVVTKCMKNFSNLHMINGQKKGLGAAYMRGIEYAIKTLNPDIILQMDADLQHSPDLIPLFITLTTNGFSLVIGSRFITGGSTPDFSLTRRLQSICGNWLIRFMGGLPRIHDCTSGYRCIKTDLLKQCDLSFLSTRGYSFLPSLLFELLRNRARVIEVPIKFPDRIQGKSKLSFRDRLEFLVNIFKIRFRKSEEFLKFCIIGTTGAIVNIGMYTLLTRKFDVILEIASLFSIETSIMWNFLLSNILFLSKLNYANSLLNKLIRFHKICSGAALANYCILIVLAKILNIFDLLAYIIGIAVAVLLNYFMNSFRTLKPVNEKPF
jgi:dolichol-phosphate mannosyltransferase